MTVTFADFNFNPHIMQALSREGYTNPTPIQAQAIPAVLNGQDVLGLAQTGTGKTAAFTLPMLQQLMTEPKGRRTPRALIIAPTRELAIQIGDSVKRYGAGLKLYHTLIVGGASQNRQVDELRRGVDIVIATPGRLEDLMQQRLIDLSKIEILVLDEADRMFDIGFWPAIRRITSALPQKKQTLFFSATMPREVADLANSLLHNPMRIEIVPVSTPVDRIEQMVIPATIAEKRQILVDMMLDPAFERVVVFTRTKHGADKVARILEGAGVSTSVMHGRKSQNQRQSALGAFGRGMVRAMVATDIAARGIDVDNVTHVINYDLPHEPETYVHRIGRTARAGKTGIAISLCEPQGEERNWLRQIERMMKMSIRVAERPKSSGYVVPSPARQPNNPNQMRSRPEQSRGRFNGSRDEQRGGQRGGYGQQRDGQRGGYGQQSRDGQRGGYEQRGERRDGGNRYQRDDAPRARIQEDVYVGQPGENRREPGAYQGQRREGFIKPYGSENARNDNRSERGYNRGSDQRGERNAANSDRPAKKPFWKQRKEQGDKPQNRGGFGRPNRGTGRATGS